MGWFTKTEQVVKEFLPVGVKEFHTWADDVISLTPLPNNDSIKFALASIILELDKSYGKASKQEIATMLVKAAANQVAAFVFNDIKRNRMIADEAKNQELKDKDCEAKAAVEIKSEAPEIMFTPQVLSDGHQEQVISTDSKVLV